MTEEITWNDFLRHFLEGWKPGEHVSVVAPTGNGKTFLVTKGLLPYRKKVFVFDAKREDDELRQFGRGKKVQVIRSFPLDGGLWQKWEKLLFGEEEEFKAILSPNYDRMSRVFYEAFERVWREQKATSKPVVMYLDELQLFTNPKYPLGKAPSKIPGQVERLWLQGRSRKISLVTSTQAPRWVPAATFEQPRHHFLFQARKKSVKLFAEKFGDPDIVESIVPRLEEDYSKHHFLYIGNAFPDGVISRVRVH